MDEWMKCICERVKIIQVLEIIAACCTVKGIIYKRTSQAMYVK